MNRKILQAGPATLAVSLPMGWTKKYDIKKGQEINVEEQGSSLIIKTSSPIEEESAKVNVSALGPVATKVIGMLYQAGYKKIKANYTPNKTIIRRGKEVKELDMVRNTFDHLIGMQLWEIGKEGNENYALAVESAKINPSEFDNVLQKLCLHIVHQAEQVSEAISQNNDIFDEAYLDERLITQASDFCIRNLVSFGHHEHKKTLYYNNFIFKLESLGDKYFSIALNFHKNYQNKQNILKVSTYVIQSLIKTSDFIKEIISLYRKFDFEKSVILVKNLDEAIKDYEKKVLNKKQASSHTSYITYSILTELYESIETIFFLNYDYFKDNS